MHSPAFVQKQDCGQMVVTICRVRSRRGHRATQDHRFSSGCRAGVGRGLGMWAPAACPPRAALVQSPLGRFVWGTPQPSRVLLRL